MELPADSAGAVSHPAMEKAPWGAAECRPSRNERSEDATPDVKPVKITEVRGVTVSKGLGSRPQVRDGLSQRRASVWLSQAKTGAISDSLPARLMSACAGGLVASTRRTTGERIPTVRSQSS